jgi:hypothetical protein
MASSSSFAIAEVSAAVLSLALVVGLLAWVRYLHHKETMKTLDAGGDGPRRLESLSQARMEAQERERLRFGMMLGVLVTALGIGVLSNVLLRLPGTSPQYQPMDPGTQASMVGLAVFLLIAGLANSIAHLIWSRRHAAAAGAAESPRDRERAHIRSGFVRGSLLAAAGVGCLLALLAGVYAGDRGSAAILLGFGVFLLLSGAAAIAVHVNWLRDLERGRQATGGNTREGAIDRGDQNAE